MPSKLELLEFIVERGIVTPLMLCNEFGFKPNQARARLSYLRRQGLAESIRDPSYGYKKTWCLTLKGDDRLDYLQRKQRRG